VQEGLSQRGGEELAAGHKDVVQSSLGKLNVSSGPLVLFIANSTAGFINLSVTAFLNGKTATNSSAITIIKPSPPHRGYTETFTESGLPTGITWSVTLNGSTLSSATATITFQEPNGTYAYTVTPPAGYTANPASASLTVAGKALSESVTFTKTSVRTTYSITFAESGLATGASWSVTLNGSTQSSTAATITFKEVNGSYGFTVGTVSGYTASPPSGTVKVNGASTGQAVTFTSSNSPKGKTNQTTGVLGLPGDEGYLVIGGIVAAIAIAAGVLLMRGRRNTPPRGGDGISERKKIENQSAADGASKEQAVE
ncbi:MAG: hypothetical protein JRN35_11175, partial [Nitrososphaerota archaeon]|nr:hypothetical protein [Nitrososphaerota archaeon]